MSTRGDVRRHKKPKGAGCVPLPVVDDAARANPGDSKAEAVDGFFTQIIVAYLSQQPDEGSATTLDDVRRAVREGCEARFRLDAVTLDETHRARLLEIVDSFVARTADDFVATGVQDTRHMGLYL